MKKPIIVLFLFISLFCLAGAVEIEEHIAIKAINSFELVLENNDYFANINVTFSNEYEKDINMMEGKFDVIIKEEIDASKNEWGQFKLGQGEFKGDILKKNNLSNLIKFKLYVGEATPDTLNNIIGFYNLLGNPNKRFKILLDTQGWATVGIANKGDGWNERPFGSTFYFVPDIQDEVFLVAAGSTK